MAAPNSNDPQKRFDDFLETIADEVETDSSEQNQQGPKSWFSFIPQCFFTDRTGYIPIPTKDPDQVKQTSILTWGTQSYQGPGKNTQRSYPRLK